MDIYNIAIVAHVDHGKTTLVDALLKSSDNFDTHKGLAERAMDSYDQEKERGITIYAKNAAITYQNKKLVPDPENASIVKGIFEMWAAGINYKEIAKKFNIPPSTLYQIIRNPIYLGKIKYKGGLYKGKHSAIIDENLFNQANKTK